MSRDLIIQPEEDEVFSPDDWLSASEALRLVSVAMMSREAHIAIAKRAHAGLIRTHADLFWINTEKWPGAELPVEFWWAEGHEALDQNWGSGDFSTWLKNSIQLRAFGVKFHREVPS